MTAPIDQRDLRRLSQPVDGDIRRVPLAGVVNSSSLQFGRSLITALLYAVGIVVALGVGWKALEVLYRFYDLQNRAGYVVGAADIFSDLELRKKLQVSLKGAGISLGEQDIVIQRGVHTVRAEIPYVHQISVLIAGKRVKLLSIPLRMSVERGIAYTDESKPAK